MTDLDELTVAYEAAMEAHWADPENEGKHKASVATAERLATARKAQREQDIAAGTRSAGVGVVAEGGGE